jgi:energy-coupling factor transport system ATP-binding protein
VLQLLDDLARDRAVLVVSHEPELFQGRIAQAWRLHDGHLRTLTPGTPTAPERILTMPQNEMG